MEGAGKMYKKEVYLVIKFYNLLTVWLKTGNKVAVLIKIYIEI